MDGKSTAVALVLFLVFMAGSEGKAPAKTEQKGFRCLCVSTHSKFMPPKAIQSSYAARRQRSVFGTHCSLGPAHCKGYFGQGQRQYYVTNQRKVKEKDTLEFFKDMKWEETLADEDVKEQTPLLLHYYF